MKHLFRSDGSTCTKVFYGFHCWLGITVPYPICMETDVNSRDFELFFDGGICPHPDAGWACYFGWVIKQGGVVRMTGSGFERSEINVGSCGVELEAVTRGLRDASKLGIRRLHVYGDSQTVIECLNGNSERHSDIMLNGCEQVHREASLIGDVTFGWIPREQNAQADKLGRLAYQHSHDSKRRSSLIRQVNDLYDHLFKNTLTKEVRRQWHKQLTGKAALSQMSLDEVVRVMSATNEFVAGALAEHSGSSAAA